MIQPPGKPVILGYGHPDRGDDAVGLMVARQLCQRGVEAREYTFDGLSLLESWRYLDNVLVIDAVVTGSQPGTIFEWRADDLKLDQIDFPTSTHSFGLAEAIELGRALQCLPRRLEVIGIEARDFAPGHTPSKAVIDAVGAAADLIVKRLQFQGC